MRRYLTAWLFGLLIIVFMAGCGGGNPPPTDTTAPTNTTQANFINSGAASTNSTTVNLAISATDNVGVTGYLATESPSTPSSSTLGWVSVTSTTSYSAGVTYTFLTSTSGTKTVYIWLKDAAGNISGSAIDTITLASVAEINSQGLSLLQSRDVLGAKAEFKDAVDRVGTQTSNDADTARFFYALTRVAALGFDLASDGNSADLNRAADILDRLGCSSTGRNPFNWTATCPTVLPSGSPTGGELMTFLQDVVLPELEGATTNLDLVSSLFNKNWVEPMSSTTVESDYGDVLFFRAALKALRAQLLIMLSYNLDVDIDAQANDKISTIQQRLVNNPNLLKPTTVASADLPQARALLQGMVDDLIAAADEIQAETDPQTDDLVTLEGMTQADITQAKADLTTFKNGLSQAVTADDNETLNTTDDVIVNGNPFFSGAPVLDLRAMFPPFAGNNPTGFFPDPLFGGVLVQPTNLNADLNGNGIADIFEKTNLNADLNNNGVADIFEKGVTAKANSLNKSLHKDQRKVQTFRNKALK